MVCDVVIAGAGPNGLMLACELRLAGVHPVVLERLSEPSPENRANGLVGQVVRMLDRRGLYQPLAGESGPPQPMPAFFFGAVPMDLHMLEDNPFYLLPVPQTRIERVLADRAAELGVEVRRGHALTGLSQHADAVTVEVIGPTGPDEISSRYVVGADGAHSTTRKLAGIEFPGAASNDIVVPYRGSCRTRRVRRPGHRWAEPAWIRVHLTDVSPHRTGGLRLRSDSVPTGYGVHARVGHRRVR